MLNSPTHMYRGQNLKQVSGVWRIVFTCIFSVSKAKREIERIVYISRMASGLGEASMRVCAFIFVDADSVKVCSHVTFMFLSISTFISNYQQPRSRQASHQR